MLVVLIVLLFILCVRCLFMAGRCVGIVYFACVVSCCVCTLVLMFSLGLLYWLFVLVSFVFYLCWWGGGFLLL